MKNFLRTALVFSSIALAACTKDDDSVPTIAGIAVASPDFQVLEDAAIRGDVAVVLSNKNPNDPQGNYTVFAPTNAAFARLGLRSAPDLTALQKSFLTNTLLYHVSGGNLAGSSLLPGAASGSALGVSRRFVRRGTEVYVNGSKVLATDVQASNGTIHAIDKVLLATGSNVVESALALRNSQVFAKPELTFLVAAVVYCNLGNALATTPNLTVFAPSDQAFRELGVALGVDLQVASDITKLPEPTVRAVLLNHVVAGGNTNGRFTSELPENSALTTLGGGQLQLGAFANGLLPVKGNGNTAAAGMVIPDVQCTNGVVHVIDKVLLP